MQLFSLIFAKQQLKKFGMINQIVGQPNMHETSAMDQYVASAGPPKFINAVGEWRR